MVKLTETLVLARTRSSDLENVRKLNVWGSDLTDASILRRMPNVQVVSLSVNQLSSLIDFTYCKELEELYIRKNNIQNLAEILHLKTLPKLRILWLSDNPCAVGDRYRMTVLKTLPNLQKLDNIVVQNEEVNEAIEQGISLQDQRRTDSEHDETVTKMAIPVKQEVNQDLIGASQSERKQSDDSAVTMSLEETNKIRAQLGLRQLPIDKVTSNRPRTSYGAKSRNANLLQASLHLVRELDGESLQVLAEAIQNRLENM